MKKVKKFIRDNQDDTIIILISLISFILGCFAIGWFKALLIIGLLDAILFIAPQVKQIINKKKHGNRKTSGSHYNYEKHKHSTKKNSKTKKYIIRILFAMFIFMIISIIAFVIWFYLYIAKNAPEFKPKNLYAQESSVIYDTNGNEIATLGAENRELITYEDLPEVLVNAIVATEDSRFFQHNGVDWARFLKASVLQLLGHDEAGGASTLTMQISKNAFTSKKSTGLAGIIRKFTDVYISMNKIEKHYSKQEIMEFYVNSYYLGSGAYGVEQAAKIYFGKSVSNINLAEAALIAGLFQAPGDYDPNLQPEAAKKRQETVLKLMVKHGYITEEEKNAALDIDISTLLSANSAKAAKGENEFQGFIDTVVTDVQNKTGLNPYTTSMAIYSTMNPDQQRHINQIMNSETFNWENEVVTAGISAIDVKTGAVVAVGAGRHRTGELSYNTATMISRQIGSTSKPLYDYGPEIEYNNWSTYQLLGDEEITYSDGTKINNWDNKWNGLMTSRTALAQSRNIPALKAFKANDNSKIKQFVTSLGLHPEIDANGFLHQAHSIGGYNGESPLSMSVAYASFANGGYYVEPYTYTKIVYKETDKIEETVVNKTRVMSEETAYMVYDMLKSAANWGLGSQKNINGAEFGAKTGTSNFDEATMRANHLSSSAINDLWVCGVSPDYSIAVWYGYEKIYSDHYTRSGNTYHRQLFQKVAQGFFKSGSSIAQPAGVKSVTVEYETNPAQLPSDNTPNDLKVTELFKSGSEPTEVSTRFSVLANVTNAKAAVSGNKLTISWDAIATPDAINADKVTALMSSIWENSGYRSNAINNRLGYFGNVVYRVYAKNGGGLSLIDTTTNNKSTFNVSSDSATTYIIKAGYANYGSLDSSGTSVSANLSTIKEDTLNITLKGNKNDTSIVNNDYIDQGATVAYNDTNVTDAIKISVTKSDGSTFNVGVTSIIPGSTAKYKFTEAGTYTINYSIVYEGLTTKATRTIVVS